ncbi:MAG: hypothetical protein HY701_05400 [Gemmatimonadetes bacterium]|nr:hypothetical protein [Gemmatimonadota bacterium]
MSRAFLRTGVTASLLVVLAGCADRGGESPTEPPGFGSVPDNAAIQAQINTLINQLFPQPERREANQLFAQVMRGMASQNVGAAQTNATALINLGLATELNDPPGPETTAEGLCRLIRLLMQFVGQDVSGIDPESCAELLADPSVTVEAVGSDGGTVVTEDEFAGVQFPDGAVDQLVLVTIQEIDEEPCLPTARPQRKGCYEFNTVPEVGAFNVDVLVGVCLDAGDLTEAQEDRFRLYRFDADEEDANVEALPNAFVDFVDCSDYVAALDPNLVTRLARAAWKGVRRPLARWLGARTLVAADLGLGGLAGEFSRIGWAGSSVLVYGPSLTPLTLVRTDNEETLAADEGHFVTVVDGATWAGLSATGPGGFGDYDVLVFGDGTGSLANATLNAATWGGVVTGRVVVSAVHAGFHQCDMTLASCLDLNAEQWHNPEARTFIRQAINWVALGTTTGAYVALDVQFSGAGNPPGVPIAFLNGIGDFKAVGLDPNIAFLSKEDSVVVTEPGHPIVAGLDGDDFSGWFASYHQLLSSVPAAFSTVAEGFRRVDPSNPNNPLVAFPVIVVRP